MPFQAIETQRLYQQIADQIAGLIGRGEFTAGQRLPPERDLARSLGVSRPAVREALVALEIAGLVEVRTGSGAYVRAKAPSTETYAPAIGDAGPSPFDLIAARRMIEGEIAFAAAQTATAEDLDGIAETLAAMEEAMATGRDTREADRLFHARIAGATRNTVLVTMVESLWSHMFAPVFDGLSRRTGLPENQHATLRDHTRVYEALRDRDSDGARQAMRRHLTQVEDILLSGTVGA